jgi:CubicO group peptidase (beta-lactamase class C family)
MNRRSPAAGAFLFAACLLTFTLCAAPAVAARPSDADLAAYADGILAANYPAGEPGASALVVRDGKILLRKGYGLANLELLVPVKPEMVFELGSVTKQFTGAAVLMLAERGKLSLDDEITRWLPDFPTHGQKITVEQLLTHVSGIPSYTGMAEWLSRLREDMTLEQLIGLFAGKPLEFTPGERWAYNNSGYILLGAILEKASGKTYEDFVEQEIFAPLGMKSSYYAHQDEAVPGRVEGYEKNDTGYARARYLSMTIPYAAGALQSSVDDLWRWEQGLAAGKVVSAASLARMFAPARLTSGASSHYGYGWNTFDYQGRTVIEHGGGIFGFVTHVLRVPEEQLYVAILSNNTGTEKGPEDLGLGIAAKALGAAFEDRPTVALAERELDEYVGVYRFDAATTRTITREGTKVFSQRSGGGKSEIRAAAKDDFYFTNGASRLRFQRDAAGKVTALEHLASAGPDGVGTRTDEPLPAERQAITLDPAVYDAYAGVYELAPGFNLTVTREGDQIFTQATGQGKAEIFPQSETEFFLKVVDARITFQRGDAGDGKVTGLVLHQGGRDVPAKRLE